MPRIHSVPSFSSSAFKGRPDLTSPVSNPVIRTGVEKLTSWFSMELWETIFPYYKASAVFTHDGEPFWRYDDFIQSIIWMNNHPNPIYRGFGTDNENQQINMYEIASFLANSHQETGEPSISAPYPWYWPPIAKTGAVYEGSAGGLLGILEGVISEIYFGEKPPFAAELTSKPVKLSPNEKKILGIQEDYMGGLIRSLKQLNQPQFGLPNAGVVFQDNLVGVSEDGTLWGDNPVNHNVGQVYPSSQLKRELGNPKYNSLTTSSQYGGRGMIMLSYNYNYTDCSLSLFNDYRLVKYPNLIITTDRENFMGKPEYFGFPGPNPNGNNRLPENIANSTPPARQLAIITCLWFWMDRNRSGRKVSCHQCMQEPYRIGITGCNLIINNQDGISGNSWASNKVEYYRRICKIFGLVDFEKTIIKPPRELYL